MKTKKILALAVATVLCGGMVGCTGFGGPGAGNGNGGGGSNKTKLNIGYFNGGVSREWLEEIASEYEALHDDVDVYINPNLKDELLNQKLQTTIKNRPEDIYFTHTITYEAFVKNNLFADITDVVKSVAQEGDEKTIEARMNPTMRANYNYEDKYYALPFYTNFSGAIYDVDLFENQELYLAQDGGFTSGLEGAKAKSYGKDGLPDTYDDGFPVTFDEYKQWLFDISEKGIIPYIWNDDNSYRTNYLTSLWIGYEGVNDFSLNTTFSGTTKAGEEITPANAYKLRELNGRKFAVEMAEEIISNNYYYYESVSNDFSHISAQKEFLRSSSQSDPIAMILEGGWWENEARATFEELSAGGKTEYAYGNRRFAYVPVPKYDENAEAGESLVCTSGSIAVAINAKTKKLALAKDFLKFTLTEHAMSTFTKYVGLTRPYEYELEDGVLESLTPFGRNFYELATSDTSKIYYPTKSHPFKDDTIYFYTYEWEFGTKVNGFEYTDPFFTFLNNSNVTAADYIEGMTQNSKYRPDNYTKEYNAWKKDNP